MALNSPINKFQTIPMETWAANDWADFWRYEVGVNVIPANATEKTVWVKWGQWQTKPVEEKLHETWKSGPQFKNGMALICGPCFHTNSAKWINCIDLDNKLGIEKLCEKLKCTFEKLAEKTIVEQTDNKDKAHVLFTSDTPMPSLAAATGEAKEKCDRNELPAIEIKSGGKFISYCSPGNTEKPRRIIGTRKIGHLKDIEGFFKKILEIRNEFGLETKNTQSYKESVVNIVRGNRKVIAGLNRHVEVLRFVESLRRSYNDMPRGWYLNNARWFNENHTTEPMDDEEVQELVDQGINFIDDRKTEKIVKYENEGTGDKDSDSAYLDLAACYVRDCKIISIIDLSDKMKSWVKKFNISLKEKEIVLIKRLFENKALFQTITQIAFEFGRQHKKILFEDSQIIEAAYWILGRYHVKQIGLTGDLLFFNDKFYELNAEYFIKREARELLFKSREKNVNELWSYVHHKADLIEPDDIEKWLHLVCLNNGVYNVKTGEFIEGFNPARIILNHIDRNYNESLTYSKIDKVVDEIIDDNENKQSYYDFLSTCFYPKIGIYKQLGLVGPPGTGKTELCSLPILMFGDNNVRNAAIHQIANDPTTRNDVAYMMLNVDADLNSNSIDKIDVIKKWVTRDPMTARSIYAHNINYRPTSRLMFAANDLYEIPNEKDAEAIYDRTHLIMIGQRFRDSSKEIKNVMEKTVTDDELDGLVTYLLKNAADLYKLQKMHYPMAMSAIGDAWDRHTKGLKLFIAKWIVKDQHVKCIRSNVNDCWNLFCAKNGIASKGRNRFYEDFENLVGVEAINTKVNDVPGWYYFGIRIRSRNEVARMETQGVDSYC